MGLISSLRKAHHARSTTKRIQAELSHHNNRGKRKEDATNYTRLYSERSIRALPPPCPYDGTGQWTIRTPHSELRNAGEGKSSSGERKDVALFVDETR